MEKTDLNQFYEYTTDSNQKFIKAFAEAKEHLSPSAMRIFCHIINAHRVWLNRINKDSDYNLEIDKELGIWEEYGLEKLKKYNAENNEMTEELLDKAIMAEKIHYRNSKGIQYENTIGDIIFHIFNHANYHRGQLAKIMSKADVKPPITDYIMYKR